MGEVLLDVDPQGVGVADDGDGQVGGPIPARQQLVDGAEVVLRRRQVLGEVLLGVDPQGVGVAGDGDGQVGGPIPARQIGVDGAEVVLRRRPVLGEVLLGVDAQGVGVGDDGGGQVGGPIPARQIGVGKAEIVLRRRPVLGEVLFGVDAQGVGVGDDGGGQVGGPVPESCLPVLIPEQVQALGGRGRLIDAVDQANRLPPTEEREVVGHSPVAERLVGKPVPLCCGIGGFDRVAVKPGERRELVGLGG